MARPAPRSPLSLPRFLRDLALVLGGTALLVTALIRWVAVPWSVEGSSMAPTLSEGDRVVVDLLAYRRHAPRIGDVVLLEGPAGLPLVKRVAPEPGGRATSSGQVWVLGDNAGDSGDSRSFGAVPVHRIRGRVAFRYWPPSRWGTIE